MLRIIFIKSFILAPKFTVNFVKLHEERIEFILFDTIFVHGNCRQCRSGKYFAISTIISAILCTSNIISPKCALGTSLTVKEWRIKEEHVLFRVVRA